MQCANAGNGEEGNDGFRDHGKVDGNCITFPDTHLPKSIGRSADFAQELAIRNGTSLARLVSLVDDGWLVWIFESMAVNAVVRRIEAALQEPRDVAIHK